MSGAAACAHGHHRHQFRAVSDSPVAGGLLTLRAGASTSSSGCRAVALWPSWRGWWLLPALPPLVVMGPTAVQTVEAFRAESNLWPIMMILTAPLAAIWLGFWAWLYKYRAP